MINTANGVQVWIGSPNLNPSVTNLGQFEADTYIEVGEVEDAGQFGDQSSTVTFTSLKDGRTRKLKGPRDAGDMTLVVGNDMTDAGQEALVAAEAQRYAYNVMVVLNDAISLSGNGSVLYFAAKVMSDRLNVGNVSNVVKENFILAIDTAIFRVPPT